MPMAPSQSLTFSLPTDRMALSAEPVRVLLGLRQEVEPLHLHEKFLNRVHFCCLAQASSQWESEFAVRCLVDIRFSPIDFDLHNARRMPSGIWFLLALFPPKGLLEYDY